MVEAIMFVTGCIAGTACIYLFLMHRLKAVGTERRELVAQKTKLEESASGLKRKLEESAQSLRAKQTEVERRALALNDQQARFEAQTVLYSDLKDENGILKRDLRNIAVSLRKLELDRNLQRDAQAALDAKVKELGARYLRETIKWIGTSITANNYAACKQRLQDIIDRCRGIGFEIGADEESGYFADLKKEYEKVVRAAFEREEQARIKAQIREEQKREREIEQELKRLDRERAAIQAALDRALAEAADKHSAEVDRLRARLTEAEERAARTKSQAEMTKSGHVYVISNIGSFGDGVYKIGMTRRLEPEMRVRELGDASVPFPFDIHMMIACNDAPALENALHRALHKQRLNKTNPRKEFFDTQLESIAAIVREHHGAIEYLADPEALEYRQSLAMSEEDSEFIESVYDAAEEDAEAVSDDQ